MDVVNQALKQLGGRIEIASEQGKGSVFSILLPLTLAIIEGMLIKVGDELFIIPVNNVLRTQQPIQEEITRVLDKFDTLKTMEQLLPVFRLHERFNIKPKSDNYEDGLLIIISRGDGKEYALLVDELVGIQDVVIKKLGEKFSDLKGVSGATILGNGNVGLILDANSLVTLE